MSEKCTSCNKMVLLFSTYNTYENWKQQNKKSTPKKYGKKIVTSPSLHSRILKVLTTRPTDGNQGLESSCKVHGDIANTTIPQVMKEQWRFGCGCDLIDKPMVFPLGVPQNWYVEPTESSQIRDPHSVVVVGQQCLIRVDESQVGLRSEVLEVQKTSLPFCRSDFGAIGDVVSVTRGGVLVMGPEYSYTIL